MKRPIAIGITFLLCLAIVLTGMGWVTAVALRLERHQSQSEQEADHEERVRLALWRMDSMLVPVIARESARPWFEYRAYNEATLANSKYDANVLVPSALNRNSPSKTLLHFQYDPDGKLSSPQVAQAYPNARALPEIGVNKRGASVEQVAEARLSELQGLVKQGDLEQSFQRGQQRVSSAQQQAARQRSQDQRENTPLQQATGEAQRGKASQVKRNTYEARARNQTLMQAEQTVAFDNGNFLGNVDLVATPSFGLLQSDEAPAPMAATWRDGNLFLVRSIEVEGEDLVQGVWLDWPGIRKELLASVADLLPEAELLPAEEDGAANAGRTLVSLPLRLLPGPRPEIARSGLSPIQFSLALAWVGVLLAAVAVAWLLWGTVVLSERRASFVSAVTHELRTPLTTFRLYTDMLADEMIAPKKRSGYLNTLRVEAERLGHLVENVLAYARLERRPARGRAQRIALEGLVKMAGDRLARRAEQANMTLVIEPGDEWQHPVRADAQAVEQILFNLVDNACKYAASAEDRRIHIRAASESGHGVLRVCDHGPGVEAGDRARLFRPFSKSAHRAAETAPGVGLGLALCRRLARAMGGNVRFERDHPHGACFVVILPAD